MSNIVKNIIAIEAYHASLNIIGGEQTNWPYTGEGYSRSSGSEAEAPKMGREKNRWGFLLRRCQDTYTLWKITYCLQFLRWLPRVFTKNPSYPAYVTEGNLVTFSLRFCSLDSPLRLPI